MLILPTVSVSSISASIGDRCHSIEMSGMCSAVLTGSIQYEYFVKLNYRHKNFKVFLSSNLPVPLACLLKLFMQWFVYDSWQPFCV